jgi:hypothetical protein
VSIAQGVNKQVTFKKQSGLGVPQSGSGGQLMRRETAMGKLTKATYENNEITSHQQSTGETHGLRSSTFTLNGLLSPNTYSTLFASLLRKLFTATTPITGASLTIAGTLGAYTITRAAGDFLTDGIKIGDVIRLSVGTLHANNINKNFLVMNVTALVITGKTVNNSVMTAEGPIATCTITVIGKKSIAPLTAHTMEYWTVEEWQSDISQSELFADQMVGSIDVGLPSSGNATFALNMVGLGRTTGSSQILTTPTAETTTPVLVSVQGAIVVNGVAVSNITGASIKIDCAAANMGGVLGSDTSPDIQRGVIKVSGQITAFYQDGVMPALFDEATPINAIIIAANDDTATSDFIGFTMSKVKLKGDDKDDGQKGIIRTYPFTAEINGSGGAALANDKTILSIQDSQAA